MADLSFSPIAKAAAGAPKWGTVAAFPSSGGGAGSSATSRGGGTTAAELRQLLAQGGPTTPTSGLGSAWNPTSPITNSSSSNSLWTTGAASGGDTKTAMPSDDGRSSFAWRSPTSSSSSSQLYNASSSLSLAQAQALTADAVTVRRNHTISSAGGRIAAKYEQRQREESLQRLNSHFEQPGDAAAQQRQEMQQQQQQSEGNGSDRNGSGEADYALERGDEEELALYGKASVQRNKSLPNSRSLSSSEFRSLLKPVRH